jgi:hypothetical protein
MIEFKRTNEESLDYVLVKTIKRGRSEERIKAAKLQLWNKYALLTKKMKFKLIRIARDNGFHMSEWIENYEQEAFELLMHVVDTIRLDAKDGENNCEHLKEQWIIYQAYWGNLMSMNRNWVGDYIERNKNETAIYGSGKDGEESQVTNLDRSTSRHYHAVEEEMIASNERQIVRDSWTLVENRMTPRQKRIVQMLQDGKTRAFVKKTIGLSQKGFQEEIEGLKRNFSAIVKSLSQGRGDPMTYDDVVEKYT